MEGLIQPPGLDLLVRGRDVSLRIGVGGTAAGGGCCNGAEPKLGSCTSGSEAGCRTSLRSVVAPMTPSMMTPFSEVSVSRLFRAPSSWAIASLSLLLRGVRAGARTKASETSMV